MKEGNNMYISEKYPSQSMIRKATEHHNNFYMDYVICDLESGNKMIYDNTEPIVVNIDNKYHIKFFNSELLKKDFKTLGIIRTKRKIYKKQLID
jgi:hypothetical protein